MPYSNTPDTQTPSLFEMYLRSAGLMPLNQWGGARRGASDPANFSATDPQKTAANRYLANQPKQMVPNGLNQVPQGGAPGDTNTDDPIAGQPPAPGDAPGYSPPDWMRMLGGVGGQSAGSDPRRQMQAGMQMGRLGLGMMGMQRYPGMMADPTSYYR